MESVLGATPRGFESRVLRSSDQVIRLTCSAAAHPRGRVLVSVLVHNPALKRALIRAYVVSSATTAVPAVPLSGIEGELMRAAHAGGGAPWNRFDGSHPVGRVTVIGCIQMSAFDGRAGWAAGLAHSYQFWTGLRFA